MPCRTRARVYYRKHSSTDRELLGGRLLDDEEQLWAEEFNLKRGWTTEITGTEDKDRRERDERVQYKTRQANMKVASPPT